VCSRAGSLRWYRTGSSDRDGQDKERGQASDPGEHPGAKSVARLGGRGGAGRWKLTGIADSPADNSLMVSARITTTLAFVEHYAAWSQQPQRAPAPCDRDRCT
jgi:hypothetical protein